MPKVLPLNITEINFLTILPIWQQILWKGRVSPILPVSTMMFMGGYDLSIRPNYTAQARFFGAYDQSGDLIGVFSGHPTSDTEYRARGFYVVPSFQDIGIGKNLVHAVVNAAAHAGRDVCWCLPRVGDVEFFEEQGFTVMSQPFTDGVEFGPNVYMAKAIIPF